MIQSEQLLYIHTLKLDPKKITDMLKREEVKNVLQEDGQWTKEMNQRFQGTLFEITDLPAVKKAWKKLCLNFHPDKFDEKSYQQYIDAIKKSEDCSINIVISKNEMEAKFKEVTHAYNMLTDASYANKVFKANGAGQRTLDAVFNVTITFNQAFFGDTISITFNPLYVDDSGKPVSVNKKKDIYLNAEIIRLRIKEGSKTGDQIKIPNKGMCQKERRGDMIITLQVIPHPHFQIQGSDVMAVAEIPLDIMLTGGKVDILTMWGIKKLRIPIGTQPSEKLAIKKAGVSKVGNHILTIKPLFPEKSDLKKKNIWKKLSIDWKKERDQEDEENREERTYQEIFKRLAKVMWA